MTRAAAAAILALALWLSGGVFAPVTGAAGSGWLAALPSWPALAAAAIAGVFIVAWRPPAHLAALLPLIALLLPWTPGMDAGLIYAGPLVILVWAAVFALGWGAAATAWIRRCSCSTSPGRATIAAFLIALVWTSVVAWRVAPLRPDGDEPHYLIATQSLIKDGDLRIENNHRQRDYAAYAAGDLRPQYLVRGRDREIYPLHAPGLPVLAIPAFAAAGYPGVVAFLIVVMALAAALVWRIAWLATDAIGSAWFGWAIVVASCTWTFQSFLVFPDAMGAAAVACGLWLVLRLDLAAAGPAELRRDAPAPMAIGGVGMALALLPWLHTRFAVLAGGLGLMIVMRLYRMRAPGVAQASRPAGRRHVIPFLIAPIISAAAWFGFFQAIYGSPNPIVPWGGARESMAAWIPGGLAGLLFDQQFGLLPYAPALAAGIAGLFVGTAAGWRRATRLQIAVLIAAAYVAASASYAMWWAGLSVPARLLTVLLPLLAPAGAVIWQRAGSAALRTVLAAALGWTIFATASLAFADRGQLAWNVRQHKAGFWFEWLAPLVRWTEALPAFFRADDLLGRESLPLPIFYAVTAVWIAALGAATMAGIVAARALRRRGSSPVAARGVTITALVIALPVATVLALRLQGTDGSAPARAQTAFLTRAAEGHGVVFDLDRRRAVPASDAMAGLRLSLPANARGGTRNFGPLPAGRYRITGATGHGDGQVLIGRNGPVATLGDAAIELSLPVGVNALSLRGGGDRAVVLEPVAVLPRRWHERALRARRYGRVTAFFVDDGVYAETDAFWVGGGLFANVVLQADPGVRAAQLELVNAPVPNHLSVIGAAEPFARALAPGERVLLPVAFDAHGAARLQIDSSAGFIPAQVDTASQDRRYLGVYVKVREVS